MFRKEATKLSKVFLIKPDIHYDYRGEYIETFHWHWFNSEFPDVDFKVDDISVSRKNTIRGLHGDGETWKLIQCLEGEILQTVVDLDTTSRTYLQWEQFYINEKNRHQILIPPLHANGHLCLSDRCIFSYKQTSYYEDQKQFQYHYLSLGIPWPVKTPILSERDKTAISIDSYLKNLRELIKEKLS